MEITVQLTPNPNAHKYILPVKTFAKPLSFASADDAADHALAAGLFALGNVYNVFMAQDFITVNKLPDAAWAGLDEAIVHAINNYFDELMG